VLEFIGFGLLIQVPLLLLVLNLGGLQHDQLAAEAISRDSLRSYLLIGRSPVETAERVAQTYGIDSRRLALSLICENNDGETEGNIVTVTTQIGSVKAKVVGLR
jgi:hypothetical protein